MHVSVVDNIGEIPAAEWNALAGEANPFLRHEFLLALEATGCAVARTGWLAQHLIVQREASAASPVIGAVPMYLKNHSFGEFVFDWAWAQAYEQAGLRYYPKLVACVPFSPVTGPRLLTIAGEEAAAIKDKLISAALELMQEHGVSSLHWLFLTPEDSQQIETRDHLARTGFQFHWSNPGYRDFDDFLSTFTAQKRKKIKRERRFVSDAGITMEILTGTAIEAAHWDSFYEFHLSTLRAYGGSPFLTREFFHQLGATLRDNIVLVFARRDSEYVAGALNLRGTDTLYGRYWGTTGDFPGLHFETCYYTAIEYCIAHQLSRFEAGAQGEHKLARGFTPVVTRSAHRLVHPQFNRAVGDYLARERIDVDACMNELNEHAPFKKLPATEE